MIKTKIFTVCMCTLFSLVFAHPKYYDTYIKTKSTTSNKYIFETYSITRTDVSGPNINYYLSRPDTNSYPIVVLVGGSTDRDDLASIAEFHRYFWNDISQTHLGVISVEPWGINGDKISPDEFMAHYTRSQILHDYQQVIDYTQKHPPIGWNGKLALLGVSEGGSIVIRLNENKSNNILATVIWSGASDWSWQDEIWVDMQPICKSMPTLKDCKYITTRSKYDLKMDEMLKNPTASKYFFNMTYMYMADALKFNTPDYKNIHGSLLIVSGTKDTLIQSSDDFYRKAKANGVDVTYWRIEGMDHYIRKRPDLITNSFIWLKNTIQSSNH